MLVSKLLCLVLSGAVPNLQVLGVAEFHPPCFGSSKSRTSPSADLLSFLLVEQCIDAQLEVVGIGHRSNLEPNACVLHQSQNEGSITAQPGEFCHQKDGVGAAAEVDCLLKHRTVFEFLAT